MNLTPGQILYSYIHYSKFKLFKLFSITNIVFEITNILLTYRSSPRLTNIIPDTITLDVQSPFRTPHLERLLYTPSSVRIISTYVCFAFFWTCKIWSRTSAKTSQFYNFFLFFFCLLVLFCFYTQKNRETPGLCSTRHHRCSRNLENKLFKKTSKPVLGMHLGIKVITDEFLRLVRVCLMIHLSDFHCHSWLCSRSW